MTKRFLLSGLFLLVGSVWLWSQQSSIETIRKEREALLEQIRQTDEALSANQQSVKAQLYRYTLLNDKIKATEQYLTQLNAEYNKTRNELKSLNEEHQLLSIQLEKNQEQYAQMVRQLYVRLNDNDKLMFIFSADNLNQSIRRIRYLNDYARHQRKQAEDIRQKQTKLEELRAELEETKNKQARLVAEQQAERDRLRKERSQQNALVQNLRKKSKSLQAELSRQKQQADKLNRQIESIIAEENKKSSTSGQQGSQTIYAMNVDEKKLAAEFGNNKGGLPFPLSEPGTVVVHFGEQKHRDMKYVQTYSNGIDIQTTAGASARAIFKGTVSKVFSVQGSNLSIIVRHGNYLSVYSNLERVYVKTGQVVKTGDLLGKVYVDADQKNLTIMHFQVWKDFQKLNPEEWIKKR